MVVWLAVPTGAFWHSWLTWPLSLLVQLLGGQILVVVALVQLVCLLVCLVFFCVILFLWYWVQGGHSFEPIYWPFVGGLVGTVPSHHPDTGLLQFFQLTQAPAKGSALWLPSGQRCGLSRGQRGSCWCGGPQPWVPRCTQPRKPVLCWCILRVQSDTLIWNKKSLGVLLPLHLGEGF